MQAENKNALLDKKQRAWKIREQSTRSKTIPRTALGGAQVHVRIRAEVLLLQLQA